MLIAKPMFNYLPAIGIGLGYRMKGSVVKNAKKRGFANCRLYNLICPFINS